MNYVIEQQLPNQLKQWYNGSPKLTNFPDLAYHYPHAGEALEGLKEARKHHPHTYIKTIPLAWQGD